jgi:hypothetical protein
MTLRFVMLHWDQTGAGSEKTVTYNLKSADRTLNKSSVNP